MNGQAPDAGGVLAWILGAISIGGALYGVGRRIFNTVTRDELQRIMASQDKKFLEALAVERKAFERAIEQETGQRQLLHDESRETARETFDRLSDLEKGVSRIEGQLSGRFPRQDWRN